MPPRKKHIYLIGFSGSGKSTVGPTLAKRLKYRFIDIDQRISRQLRLSIPDIFAQLGEKKFRDAEKRIIAGSSAGRSPSVIAVGGGAFENAPNRSAMQSTGVTIFLSCARRELYRRLHSQTDRPLLNASSRAAQRDKVGKLLDRRLKNYRRADITVSTTNRTPTQVVDLIIRRLDQHNA